MNVMLVELYDALMSAGADERKARLAAESMASSNQDMERKFVDLREDNVKLRTEMAKLGGDLRQEMANLRGDLRQEMAGLRQEMTGLKGELQQDMTGLKGDLRQEMTGLRGELTLVKWMLGALIALGVAIFLRVLFL